MTIRTANTAPATATSIERSMADASALLRLMWLASPALPVGGFSYSEGLESAVESGRVGNEAEASDWLADQLALALGRSELPVVAAAFHAWQQSDGPRLEALNAWVRSTRESAEPRLQTEQMGRSLADWLRNGGSGAMAGDPRVEALARLAPAPTWPIAFALAAAQTGASADEALLAFAFGWAENMTQAAMKTVPLGQAAAQRILARLAAAIPDIVERALRCGDDERVAFAPMLAVLSAQHETQYSRLFRS